MEHNAIVKACMEGDRNAQRSLIDGYSSLLMSICLRYCRSQHDAEDALQESWIRIFKGMEGYQEAGYFKAWICRITIHTALRYMQRQQRHANHEEIGNEHFDEIKPEALELMKARDIIKLIAQLPDRAATVFKLYVIDELNHSDIATLLGISESTSRVYLTRAREGLRILIADQEKVENQ